MDIKRLRLDSFAVLGKLGSTKDGVGFVQRLWKDLEDNFHEIKHLALKDPHDTFMGFWGLMSDFDMTFQPWKDFKEGYYLAGVEIGHETKAPKGWTKWVYPGYEYAVVLVDDEYQACMAKGLDYLKQNELTLAGAIVDFMDPKDGGQPYIYFPTKKL